MVPLLFKWIIPYPRPVRNHRRQKKAPPMEVMGGTEGLIAGRRGRSIGQLLLQPALQPADGNTDLRSHTKPALCGAQGN